MKGKPVPFARRPDARIWWDQSGTGDPVLLIMGHAYGAGMWHRTVPELAASYRVIGFGNRGVGRSSDPPGPCPVPLMADDALAVLDAAGHAYITDAARAANQEVLRFLAGIPGPAGGSGTSTRPATSTADT